ncbi:hypothetical protein [Paenibacillus sp. MDMC362]|uniref:hypothetical protein n=1 Tax=Paenibacillus sp. MDMC362 TaxID=2977365 RepID=UPI000DC268D4|nr:hypothetical protein [Paenibacillus sp. MDMC362]RAR42566.1 hypothetical protein DP091_18295 [Paenibacillus sp. MDMC362]
MKKHQWIATLLSLICTGLGMFYIGTPGMIIGGMLLMALQGAALFIFFMTLGFLGLIIGPLAIGLHIIGLIIPVIYFNYRSPKKPLFDEKRKRQLSSPWKIVLRTVIGLALFAGSIYAGYTWGSAPFMKTAAEKREVQEAAESYLEQKYNEPFKVTDVDYTWAIGSYNLRAHPVQSPELEFTLSSDEASPPDISNDTYLNLLWGQQLRDRLKPLLAELYPDQAFANAYVYVNSDIDTIERDYNQLANTDGHISQNISLIVFADLTADNLAQEKERVLELIRRLPSVAVPGETDLHIEYYAADLKTPDRVKKLERDFDMNGKPSTHIFREFDISKITSTDDIEIIGLE